jgi:hypothetical protein
VHVLRVMLVDMRTNMRVNVIVELMFVISVRM